MDATTRRLCQMLKTGDPELRVAAARVLGELGPEVPAVLGALSQAVARDAGPVRLYALDALAKSRTAEAVRHILPALSGPEELRHRAVEAIARFGASAVPHLKDAVLGGDMLLRKGAASALAQTGGKAAHELLLRALAEGVLDLSKHVCFEMDHAIQRMAEGDRAAFLSLVEAYLAQSRVQKSDVAAASGLILLGFLKDPNAKKTLLRLSHKTHSPEVRRRALLALRGIAGALTASDVASLVSYLEEDDLANVVIPAVELLRPVSLPAAMASQVVRLAGSQQQVVRDFAIYKMGRLDTPAAASILIEYLDAPQNALHELALSSLQRNPAAVPPLIERLKDEEQVDRLWTIARVLEPQVDRITAAQRRALTALLLRYLEEDDRRADPVACLLRHADPHGLDAALLARAGRLKDKKRYAEAHRMLKTLLRGDTASREALYQAAVVALKVSPKGIGRSERAADACLRIFDQLLADESFDLAPRLLAERALGLEDLFYVGFHFSEQLTIRRDLGGALLQHVIAARPRSALAHSARNKLRLEAFPPEAWKPPAPPARKAATRKAAKPPAKRKAPAKPARKS